MFHRAIHSIRALTQHYIELHIKTEYIYIILYILLVRCNIVWYLLQNMELHLCPVRDNLEPEEGLNLPEGGRGVAQSAPADTLPPNPHWEQVWQGQP